MENVVSDCPCDWKKQGQLTKAEQGVLAFFFQRDIKKAWLGKKVTQPWLAPARKVKYTSAGEGLLGARKTLLAGAEVSGGVTVEGKCH